MQPKPHRKTNSSKRIRTSKRDSAKLAIGRLEKNVDLFILTYGQFSLIDALIAILDQTGPAHVSLSTWTAAHAHLDKAAELMASASVLSYRMIVDRSFRTRQPKYFDSMIDLFGLDCIREITTHAKFMLIRNDEWDIVVRTSMNLNENPRLENIEISDNRAFADFFETIVDGVFAECQIGESMTALPDLEKIQESTNFKLVAANHISIHMLKEASYTHEIHE